MNRDCVCNMAALRLGKELKELKERAKRETNAEIVLFPQVHMLYAAVLKHACCLRHV